MSEKEIIKTLAAKYNLTNEQVEEAVFSQFKFVGSLIRKGEFEAVRLPYLGKFHVRKERLEYLNSYSSNEKSD